MTEQERKLLTNIPSGKILIQGAIRGDIDKWFNVPFCIARGITGYVGYIVLLSKLHKYYKAPDESLDIHFPSNTLLGWDGIALESRFYVGHRIIGFDSGGFIPSTQMDLFTEEMESIPRMNGQSFEVFCKHVLTNAQVAFDLGRPMNYNNIQGELWEN